MSIPREDGVNTVWCEECEKVRVVTSRKERALPRADLPGTAVAYEGQLLCGHYVKWVGAREGD